MMTGGGASGTRTYPGGATATGSRTTTVLVLSSRHPTTPATTTAPRIPAMTKSLLFMTMSPPALVDSPLARSTPPAFHHSIWPRNRIPSAKCEMNGNGKDQNRKERKERKGRQRLFL
jgi:hypothetical protein